MRILVATPALPVPTSGGRTRVYNLIKQLAARHEISVISFIQPSEQSLVATLAPFCRRIELVPFEDYKPMGKWHNRLAGWSRLLLSRRPRYATAYPVRDMRGPLRKLCEVEVFDVIVFELLYLVELVDDIKSIPAILVEENVESDVVKKSLAHARDPVHWLRDWLMWRQLAAYEQHWLRRFPTCVAVSEEDAARLRELSPATKVYVVPNGVDSRYFAPSDHVRDPTRLLFFGTLNYGPNVEGLLWFCREILPEVRKAKPQVSLEIIGLNPAAEVSALQREPGIQLTGFVSDVRPRLWSAAVCVVPLRVGGGDPAENIGSSSCGLSGGLDYHRSGGAGFDR